jgi:nitrate/TMAO reductase-like tetraheme cytochrome c subunit
MRQASFTLGELAPATHQAMALKGASKTCIDCHKGIAHQLPEHDKDPNE